VENIETFGWEAAARGMRNPMNSWSKNDTTQINGAVSIGDDDMDLMKRLIAGGTEHRKFLRMIHVQMDVVAPIYWWKEYDTYKIGTVANSCSTMHRIHAKKFEDADFSTEHLVEDEEHGAVFISSMHRTIADLNTARDLYLETKDKKWWWQMIQLLPSSYNQRRTVDLNYEVCMTIIRQRRGHKLDEWHDFIEVLENLPYMKEFTQ
jgi:hypothetical protein